MYGRIHLVQQPLEIWIVLFDFVEPRRWPAPQSGWCVVNMTWRILPYFVKFRFGKLPFDGHVLATATGQYLCPRWNTQVVRSLWYSSCVNDIMFGNLTAHIARRSNNSLRHVNHSILSACKISRLPAPEANQE